MANPVRRILVVDDEPLMRGLLLNALGGKGYQVDSCVDGKMAMDQLASQAYDLVITDHDMPEMTGVELIRTLRSRGERTPVVLTTSHLLEDLIGPEETMDRVAYLRKPFGLTELHSSIRAALKGEPFSSI